MKKILFICGCVLVTSTVLSAWSRGLIDRPAEKIDLSSTLITEAAPVFENGCKKTLTAEIKVSSPVEESKAAEFKVNLRLDAVPVRFKIISLNGAAPPSESPFSFFIVDPGKTISIKVSFETGGNDFIFNKPHILDAAVLPRRYSGSNFSFYDDNKTNDLLRKEIFVGSPNAICSRCIETETVKKGVEYSFYITGVDYSTEDCQKFPVFLSSPAPVLRMPINRTNESKVYFQFIPNGTIENSSVERVLIRNNEGKYLTFNNNIPKFMDRIEDDTRHLQDWVLEKGVKTPGKCYDKTYKLVQYIDNSKCFELYQLKISGEHNLLYRTGIRNELPGERILIAPRLKAETDHNTN